jgi:RecB family endonuclease NucS
VGRLDLPVRDQQDRFLVIELKAGVADEKTVAQLLRYMGWIKLTLSGGTEVRGIIVAHDFTDALRYAVAATNNIQLKRYEVRFEFSDIEASGTDLAASTRG